MQTKANNISTGTALYYPYIHPRKLGHLKSALIYWDRVRRIVPDFGAHGNYVQGDDEDVRLLADRGLLVATRPEPYAERASRKFFEHIEPQSGRFRIDIATARALAQDNRGIHIEKIGQSVLSRLLDLKLAYRFGDWVSMHDEVDAFYMFCLASEMSDRIGAPLFTDSADDAHLGQSLLFESDSEANVSKVLLRVGFKLPSPEKMQDVPTHLVANFAKRRAAERQRFREVVEGIVEKARSMADPNAINDYLQSERSQIEEAIQDLNATIDELRVGSVESAAKITVPTAAAAALTGLSIFVTAAGILGAAGLAISTISCYAATRGKLRQARASSPYHYLISVEKELGSSLMSRVRRTLRRLRRTQHQI